MDGAATASGMSRRNGWRLGVATTARAIGTSCMQQALGTRLRLIHRTATVRNSCFLEGGSYPSYSPRKRTLSCFFDGGSYRMHTVREGGKRPGRRLRVFFGFDVVATTTGGGDGLHAASAGGEAVAPPEPRRINSRSCRMSGLSARGFRTRFSSSMEGESFWSNYSAAGKLRRQRTHDAVQQPRSDQTGARSTARGRINGVRRAGRCPETRKAGGSHLHGLLDAGIGGQLEQTPLFAKVIGRGQIRMVR